jgi:succinyl-CoA synthetase alpha subunit
MIGVFKNSGFELVHEKLDFSTIHLKLPLTKFNKVMSLHLLREKLATQASLLSAFNPKKIVYVGNECAFWYNIYQYRKDAILFVQSNDILEKIHNEKPDLLIINVSDCKNLLKILELDSIKVLIITARLNEPIKSEVISLIKKQGIWLIGPNSTGLFCNTLDNKINISPIALAKEGRLAIATHSNLLGISLVGYFNYIGLGVGCFVSVGDKADVSGNDLLYIWQDDSNIDIIVLNLDSFGDPITFSLLARKISKQKPIFAVKSGRTLLSLGASRHESFVFSNTDFTVEGLFKQTGIIRAETLEELLDDVLLAYTCDFLSDVPYVSIISNSVGANLMAVDTFEANKLILDRIVYVQEPMIESYKSALLDVLSNSKSYYIEVIFAPPEEISYEFLENFLNEILYTVNSIEHNKTVVVNVLSYLQSKNRVLEKEGLKRKIAVFAFVERSLRALGKLLWYANYKKKAEIYPQDLQNLNIKEARNYIRKLLRSDKTYQLTQIEVMSLFDILGIKFTKIEEEGLYNISIGFAYDKLFGAIMGISYYLYGVNIAYEAPIVRVLPLTLLDIEEVINLIDKKDKLKVHSKEKLSALFIRLSEVFLHIPEIKQLDLPNLVVSENGFYFAKAIIKAKKDDSNLKSFTINF